MKRGPGRPRTDPAVRFWSKVQKTETCWNWTDSPNQYGYGRLGTDGRHALAHRFSWELHGLEPLGRRSLDHRCHNRMCVNPDHLRIVNQSQNNQNLSGPQARNRTGVRGVTWVAGKKCYRVGATLNGVTHFGGYFKDLDEAAEAARQLRLSLFTHNDLDRKEIPA